MKYGIRSGMLGEPLEKEFAIAKEIGFDGIEYCIGGNYKDDILWKEGGAERLKALADKNEMEISSLSPGVFAGLHPAIADPTKRAEGREMMTHVIEVCPSLQTKWILVPMFPGDIDKWDEETWKLLIDGFKQITETAEENKVILGLESTFSAEQLLMIIDRVGSEYLKVYYDVGNMTHWGKNVPAELRLLGSQICMIHIKDTGGKPLGEGRVDFKGVSTAIQEIGYDGYMVLETPGGSDPKVSAARNLAFTKKLGETL